jgi:hypothetical protein
MITGNEPATAIKDVDYNDSKGEIAFHEQHSNFKANFSGLTIRQHFAIMALQGILSNPTMTDDVTTLIKEGKLNVNHGKTIFADIAIQAADELIKGLNSEK